MGKLLDKIFFKSAISIGLLWSGIWLPGCGEDPSATSNLNAPQLVIRNNDTAAFEKGIGSWPGSSDVPKRGIRLEWHNMDADPIGGYIIYRTSTTNSNSGPIDFLKAGVIDLGQSEEDTVFIDEDVTEKVRYYYQVSAFERSGNKAEGKRSETADYMLGSAIEGITPANGAKLRTDSLPVFRWKTEDGSTGYTVLRVYEANPVNNELRSPVWIYAGYPPFTDPFFLYNKDGKAGVLEKGKTYRWYVSQIVPGQRNYGSSSKMQNFTIE
ncbi:MAG: hypothetical protein V4642_01685 [Bacteroidota bacterium]